MYFFWAFCCFLLALRVARASDLALGAATAAFGMRKPKLRRARTRIAPIRFIDFCGILVILQHDGTRFSITEVSRHMVQILYSFSLRRPGAPAPKERVQ